MAAYLCATNCFADRTRPAEHTDKCVQSCMAPVQNISKLLQFHGKDINVKRLLLCVWQRERERI